MSLFNDTSPILVQLTRKSRIMMKFVFPVLVALIVPAQPSFAQQQPSIPSVNADESHVLNPPQPIEPDMKGFGTRAVEGHTLDEMLRTCRARPSPPSAVEQARCEQLLRTMKNQPGNNYESS